MTDPGMLSNLGRAILRRDRWLVVSLLILSVLAASIVAVSRAKNNEYRERTPGLRSRFLMLTASPQGPDLDYSNFKHSSQKHASLSCATCHERSGDNSTTPRFPGHKACTGCHLAQFVTPNVPMCAICHMDMNSSNPPLKGFPSRFKEGFNVNFDHAQHMAGSARPPSGCAACHGRQGRSRAALGIPTGLSAHNLCYTCHRPDSRSASGREIASCGVCHDQKAYARTLTNARAFRYAFSHAKHGPGQRLGCTECHQLTAGASQSRQVSSPSAFEHFPMARGMTCLTCHNGKRSFGGDLAFKDCRRCHSASSFKMPM
jgi:c(7)-type cytochrome triheme protein